MRNTQKKELSRLFSRRTPQSTKDWKHEKGGASGRTPTRFSGLILCFRTLRRSPWEEACFRD